ncbi:MAG: hypothetical protein A2Y17_04715 [Clostridiales bacterium GWF2_38_85]|nr:MAG: hypothetical protein A2Y17_04715 [Clostridiales bacterium GWF2_38_85]HBL84410.1 hypothetical protein [Clostridiales bacterium]
MDTIIYADIYFIINFCVDFVCIYIATAVLKLPIKALRLTAAAAVGAVYSLLALYYQNILIHLAIAFLLCVIAVKVGFVSLLKLWILFIISSVLIGGIFTVIYIQSEANELAIFAALPAAALITYIYGKLIKNRIHIKTAKLKLKYKGKEISVVGFVDSGNKLCDPISGDNVVLVKKDIINSLCELNDKTVGVRLIPVRTAAGNRVLFGFRPDVAEIKTITQRKSNERKLIIAIDDSPGSFCGFNANIPGDII